MMDDEDERKAYHDLKTGILDYYTILGVSKDDSIEKIKEIGAKKLAKYHPDRINKLTTDKKELEKYNEQYKFIHEAYHILRDPIKKKHYDITLKHIDESDFYNQRDSFKEYQNLQIKNSNKDAAQIEFDKTNDYYDKKIGLKRHELKKKLTHDEIGKKIANLESCCIVSLKVKVLTSFIA